MQTDKTLLNLAEQASEFLIKKTFSKHGILFPLNLQAVCKTVRIPNWIVVDDLSSSGYLKKVNKKAQIVVKKERSVERMRFTIAHEIGHYLLDSKLTFMDSRSGEQVINHFASSLLMPKVEFGKKFTEMRPPKTTFHNPLDIGENSIRIFNKLRKYFGVSIEACLIRVQQLRLLDDTKTFYFIASKTENRISKKETKYRIKITAFDSKLLFIPTNKGIENFGIPDKILIELGQKNRIYLHENTFNLKVLSQESNKYKDASVNCNGYLENYYKDKVVKSFIGVFEVNKINLSDSS